MARRACSPWTSPSAKCHAHANGQCHEPGPQQAPRTYQWVTILAGAATYARASCQQNQRPCTNTCQDHPCKRSDPTNASRWDAGLGPKPCTSTALKWPSSTEAPPVSPPLFPLWRYPKPHTPCRRFLWQWLRRQCSHPNAGIAMTSHDLGSKPAGCQKTPTPSTTEPANR